MAAATTRRDHRLQQPLGIEHRLRREHGCGRGQQDLVREEPRLQIDDGQHDQDAQRPGGHDPVGGQAEPQRRRHGDDAGERR